MKAVLDLFAGTGVGVACHQLGVPEYGVEIWKPAIATREVVGFNTPYNDVWDVDKADDLDFDTLWASPPCQTFSTAGKGKGRQALDQIIHLVESGVWRDVVALKKATEPLGDDRTGLVLTPLSYIHRFLPTYVALEQVPTVLPVWESYAGVLERGCGYSVWTGYLHAEQYGVPQTRKRAFLIARRDGTPAQPPKPSVARVSVYDLLGIDGLIITGGATTERYTPRSTQEPCPPITGAGNTYYGTGPRFVRTNTGKKMSPGWAKLSREQASLVQTYPEGFPFRGSATEINQQIGNAVPPLLARRVLETFL